MIEWFARNSVAANLLMAAILIAGIVTLTSRLNLEVWPNAEVDTISVSVALRGATPEDMELGVATRIEEALQGLIGIEKIQSTSQENSTTIQIEINEAYDPREILDEVKNRVDSINTFPVEAEQPIIALAQRRIEVISVALNSIYGEAETRQLAEQVRDDLLRIEGISQVDLDSVRDYEIGIELDQDELRNFDLTLRDVANAISSNSQDITAGNIRTDNGDILLRSQGQAYRHADFAEIVVKTNPDGSIIRIGDVATVLDGFQEEDLIVRFNGESAALLHVFRTEEEDSLNVAKLVRGYIDERNEIGMPVGTSIGFWDDDSTALTARLSTLGSSALQGGLLVIILLALFLRPAVAFWVTLGIPVTFMGAIVVIDFLGISINVMSLFGFITVLGIVVDDAIVTGESVYSRLQKGEDGLMASINGTKSVAVPVTFGILTTVAAFVPITQLEGRLERFFVPIPAVVIPVLLFSLIESKLILPAHLKHIKLRDKQTAGRFTRWQMNFAEGFESMVLRFYKPALEKAIEYRYSVMTLFLCVFVVIVMSINTGWSRFVFIPSVESDGGSIILVMQTGTPVEVTDRHVQRFVEIGEQLREEFTNGEGGEPIITNIFARAGGSGSHLAAIRFEGIPISQRVVDVSSVDIMNEWRKRVGDIPGSESLTFQSRGFSVGEPINIELNGQSFEELEAVSDKIKERLGKFSGVFDIADSLANGKEEIEIELKPQGYVLGLSRSDIVGQVSEAFNGLEAQRIQRGRDDVRVIVRFSKSERRKISTLKEMLISTDDGRQVLLTDVADLIPSKGPSQIVRINQFRTVTVTADVDKESTNMTIINRDITEFLDQVLSQYPSITATLTGEAEEQRKVFSSVLLSFFGLLFVIYALLALPLKSYGLPLIVMSVIPFSLIGGVLGHWILGIPLSLLSILGLLALVGVVINDSLVLVDYIRQIREKGVAVKEAVKASGVARFRPVLLTSLTTFFGLMPLTFIGKADSSAVFLQPMAVSLSFGIIFATFITLFFIPINLLIMNDIKEFLIKVYGKEKAEVETS